MKFNETKLIDYFDGELSAEEQELLQQALCEDERVVDAKLAMDVLKDWEKVDPIKVSSDFWPRVRELLPASPKQSVFHRFSRIVWPTSNKWALSARVAVVAAVLAMGAMWFGPQRTVAPVSAITDAEQAFIERSLKMHEDYNSLPAANNILALPAGDASMVNAEHDADENYVP